MKEADGRQAEYLDIRLLIVNGFTETGVFNESYHSCLPPYSCRAPPAKWACISTVAVVLIAALYLHLSPKCSYASIFVLSLILFLI